MEPFNEGCGLDNRTYACNGLQGAIMMSTVVVSITLSASTQFNVGQCKPLERYNDVLE